MSFLKFDDNKFVLNHSFMSTDTLFTLILKSWELGLDAITQVSSAYKMILA
jgi:hypothetical protein